MNARPETETRNYRIPLFCMVTLLFWFSMYTCVPILTAYVEYLGASYKMAGLIVGMYGLSQMLLRIPVGVVSDRYHKRKLFIVFGLFFSVLSGVGILVTQQLTWILLLRAAAGAAAATWVDFTVLFASYYRKEETTQAIGTISFYNSLGQMFGILCGGWFADMYGWESSFLIGAAVGVLGLTGAFFLVETPRKNTQEMTFKGVLEVGSDKMLLTVSFLAILFQVLTFATVFGFTPVYAQSLGATRLDMGLLTFFSTFPMAIASLVGGRYAARKLGEKNIIVTGFVLTGVFTILIPFSHSLWMLMITQCLAGFGRGFTSPVLMALSIKHMDVGKRATAMGFYQAIYGLGMFAGPLFMGIAGDWLTLKQGFIIIGALGCVAAWLSHTMLKQRGMPLRESRSADHTF
ncbi:MULTISPECIES: MFS transporter [unclassified Paenibacillus]|uniref:MFS transporter n=1 Tax=unclassified Paenibacillus TaxID=185978 RepID=UPI001AE692BD|nr:MULTISPECIES: MFS transporter [unclassified Paenibacillus]MBP1155111.1 MFS family permease [Paenibacillus sp. PvP091]MBP1169505.1 MFS family permease [Paenibacillus sp. PvR098]MBP2440533.1 MFS family permease [Paenibacillus sp. PvP052]